MLRLGCVSYINALPLIHFLDPQKARVLFRPPAQLIPLLEAGEVDAALIPIVYYFTRPDLYLVPNLAIASRGAVESVKLFYQNGSHPSTLQHIYLDTESRTSQELLKVILKNRFQRDLKSIDFIQELVHPDIEAKLLIGDKALLSQENGWEELDLGLAWWEWTQKPFVYAAWMTPNPDLKEIIPLLNQSYNEGKTRLNQIIQTLPQYPQKLLERYFTKSISYELGEAEKEGIQTFWSFLKSIRSLPDLLELKWILER